MMFIPGLRVEMRVLALLLVVYFMSLTWTVVSSETEYASVSPASIATKIASISPTTTTTTASSTATTSTTSTPTPSTVTELPLKQPTPAPSGRKFDGASFAGGIILGIVLAIIFILVFKWWQSRNKSYHSL